MKPTEPQYLDCDTYVIKWHITDENEVDFTIYQEHDGGRLELPDEPYTLDYVLELLEEEL